MAAAKLGDTLIPTGPQRDVPAWMPVVDHVLDRLPAIASGLGGSIKKSGMGGHIVALWITVGALAVGLVVHVAGDGSLRSKVDRTEAKVDRTECHVEWLVERAVAEDRGEPAPPFSPLACDR